MLIGILSDTHSHWDERMTAYLKDCDEIWHAGDIGSMDVLRKMQEICPVVRAVHGNIDHGEVSRACPVVQRFTVGGVNVWMTHIGGYPGKYAPGVAACLRNSGANLFVSGHSHILKVMPDKSLGLLHINPGAAGTQGWQKVRTLVRLKIEDGTMKELEVIELNKPRIA